VALPFSLLQSPGFRKTAERRNSTMHRSVLAAALLVASSTLASAHDWSGNYGTGDIDARRANQTRRIEEGRRSGQLTWGEYRYLRREQAQIAADERRAKADGYISSYERRRLNRELDQSSSDIHRLRHNDRVDWSYR
jgi:uncharacterized membrane protein YebE (DUF533 family)